MILIITFIITHLLCQISDVIQRKEASRVIKELQKVIVVRADDWAEREKKAIKRSRCSGLTMWLVRDVKNNTIVLQWVTLFKIKSVRCCIDTPYLLGNRFIFMLRRGMWYNMYKT